MTHSRHTQLRGRNAYQNNEGGRPQNNQVMKVERHYLHSADRVKTRPDNHNVDLTKMFSHHLAVDRPHNDRLHQRLAIQGLENRDEVDGGSKFGDFFRGLGHGIEKGLGVVSKVAPLLPLIL